MIGKFQFPGYSGGPSAKSEVKTFDGNVHGTYSYVDSNNELQTVDYTAGPNGFRAAATNLPVAPVDTNQPPVDTNKPVEDTPEVVAARNAHLAEVEKAKSQQANEPETNDDTEEIEAPAEAAPLMAPEPVDYTPEVKEARAQHLQAVEDAKKIHEYTSSIETVEPVTFNIAHPSPVLLKTTAPVLLKSHAYHTATYPVLSHSYAHHAHLPYTVQYL